MFIDESGDAVSSLVLTAVEMRTATVDAARSTTSELTRAMGELIPAFAREKELHAQRLARSLTPTEVAKAPGLQPFRTHERHFIYQHALHHLSELPSVRVYTAMWRWKGKFKPKGQSGGRRYRDLLTQLLEWISEDPTPIGSVTIDRGGQEVWYRKALDAAQEKQATLWTIEMPDSRSDQLVQLTDLAAFAAFQSAIPGQPGSHPFMKDWHRTALEPVFADRGNGYGLRHFVGNDVPVAK